MNKGYKKFFALLLAAGMVTSLAACGVTEQKAVAVFEEVPESTVESGRTDSVENSSGSGKEGDMATNDFSFFSNNMKITGADLSALNEEERSVLYQQAKYCQTMTEAAFSTLRWIGSRNALFTFTGGRSTI